MVSAKIFDLTTEVAPTFHPCPESILGCDFPNINNDIFAAVPHYSCQNVGWLSQISPEPIIRKGPEAYLTTPLPYRIVISVRIYD